MTNVSGNESDLRTWKGRTVVDPGGKKVGTLADIYADNRTGEPEWLAISTGQSGTKVSFVPIEGANLRGSDEIVIDYDSDTVKDAPTVEPDGTLTPHEEERLYRHYQDSYIASTWDRDRDTEAEGTDQAMTRSEEELRIEKERRPAGQARLHKWIETENVNIVVPVTRERARLVTEPITDANRDAALRGPDLKEDEHVVTLSEEEVDVSKRTVPKERVRLEKEAVTEDVTVSEEVRKERIEAEGEIEGKRRR